MSKLSKRLQVIASIVEGKRVADVGCDHGKLSYYLLENKIVDSVIVSDISMPSLQKAIDLIGKKDYNFEYICCDGLQGYQDKHVDECIISGMGGEEIIQIIKNSPIEIGSYILSPQHNNIMVKRFMYSMGFTIDFDIIISDKWKFYNIFRCKKTNRIESVAEFDLYFGKDNFTSKYSDADAFVDTEIVKIQNILKNTFDGREDKETYLNLLKEYKKRK